MRIAVLTNDYPPSQTGGAGVVAAIQARELERRGHEVKVFHIPPGFTRRHAIVRALFHILDLPARLSLVSKVASCYPDILLTHNLTGCGWGTPATLQRAGIPWVHVLHDVQLFEPSGRIIFDERWSWLRKLWRCMWVALRRRAFGMPKMVISPTRWLLSMHQAYGFFRPSRKVILPNPVDVSFIESSERAPSLLYVGRLDEDKGIRILLDAWQALGENRPSLSLVGDGACYAALAAHPDKRLHVHGRLAHEQISDCMSRHQILVVPSLVFENQPTVILEALAAGCQVVASDVGGVAETLAGNGILVPPGDVQALACTLRQALRLGEDEAAREKRKACMKLHDPTVVVEALEGALRSNL